MAFLALPLALLLPVLGVHWMRSAVLRAEIADPSAAWFAFWGRTQVALLASWGAWIGAIGLTHADHMLWNGLRSFPLPVPVGATVLLYLGPPAITNVWIAGLAHRVWQRLCGITISMKEAVGLAFWQNAALVIPLVLLSQAASWAWLTRYRAAALFALAALAVAIAIGRRRQGVLSLEPHAITTGALRDRLFEFARVARVPVRQLFLVPAARMRLANAFAVRGDVVVLTDYLLAHLARREVDAVLAHELAHLARKHPARLMIAPVVVMTVVFWGASGAPAILVWPLAIVAASLALFAVSRRFERAADRGALELTRDPEALISALAKIARLNHLPLEWGSWTGRLLTHPSVRKRAYAIADAAGIHHGRADLLLRAGLEDTERYAVPDAVADAGKRFSTPFKNRVLQQAGWSIWALFVLAPALVFAAGGLVPEIPRLLFQGLALAFAITLTLATLDLVAARPYVALRRRLAQRLEGSGIDPNREGAEYVGLSPGVVPRLYEGFSDWDVGFLRLDAESLRYMGEEQRFTLRRDQIANVRIQPGLPGWLRAPRVAIEWRDDQGAPGALTLRPADVRRITEGEAAAQDLFERLNGWWLDDVTPGHRRMLAPHSMGRADDPGPPRFGEVTGMSIKTLCRARLLVGQGLVLFLLAALAGALLGLPFRPDQGAGVLDTFVVAMLVAIFHRLPVWRWEEPFESVAQEREKAAA